MNMPRFTAEAALYTERGYYRSGDFSTQSNSSTLRGVEAALLFDPIDPWAMCINQCGRSCSLRPVSQQEDCRIDCVLGCLGF